ncbi:MAG: hypothetical protein GX160_01775 [Clostridiales bacterium]|nr:hypothetical protein [Clostridiales bacterium]
MDNIVILVLLGVIAILLFANFLVLIFILNRLKQRPIPKDNQSDNTNSNTDKRASKGIVFCRNCTRQYMSTETKCPYCGVER